MPAYKPKPKPKPAKQLLTVAQVAEQTNLSVRTIHRYIESGRLRAFKLAPRVIRIDPDDVAEQLLGQRAPYKVAG
jgi:excisionase family DNA binding protein